MRLYLLASAAVILLAQPALAEFRLGFADPLTGASAAIGAQILNGPGKRSKISTPRAAFWVRRLSLKPKMTRGSPSRLYPWRTSSSATASSS